MRCFWNHNSTERLREELPQKVEPFREGEQNRAANIIA
jgi:hypothetical protein